MDVESRAQRLLFLCIRNFYKARDLQQSTQPPLISLLIQLPLPTQSFPHPWLKFPPRLPQHPPARSASAAPSASAYPSPTPRSSAPPPPNCASRTSAPSRAGADGPGFPPRTQATTHPRGLQRRVVDARARARAALCTPLFPPRATSSRTSRTSPGGGRAHPPSPCGDARRRGVTGVCCRETRRTVWGGGPAARRR